MNRLLELNKNGVLKELVQAGIISPSILSHVEIYLFVDAKIKSGSKIMEAKYYASDKFNVSLSTIYRAIKQISCGNQ